MFFVHLHFWKCDWENLLQQNVNRKCIFKRVFVLQEHNLLGYSEPCQTSKMECYAKIVNALYPCTLCSHLKLVLSNCFGFLSKFLLLPNRGNGQFLGPKLTFLKFSQNLFISFFSNFTWYLFIFYLSGFWLKLDLLFC